MEWHLKMNLNTSVRTVSFTIDYEFGLFCTAFRCAYCFHINPARKKRHSAPKLMKTPSTDRLEKPLPFAPVQETNESRDNSNGSLINSPVSSPAPTQDQLQIAEKGNSKQYT